jgi:hypothetical protein
VATIIGIGILERSEYSVLKPSQSNRIKSCAKGLVCEYRKGPSMRLRATATWSRQSEISSPLPADLFARVGEEIERSEFRVTFQGLASDIISRALGLAD